jgi:methylated-DNA-[protein]-cysteine S-methyltransferase
VTAAGGKLGGFSARGGVNTKVKLLAIEGAKVLEPAPPKPPRGKAEAPQPSLFD